MHVPSVRHLIVHNFFFIIFSMEECSKYYLELCRVLPSIIEQFMSSMNSKLQAYYASIGLQPLLFLLANDNRVLSIIAYGMLLVLKPFSSQVCTPKYVTNAGQTSD
jgi:hypothetical protein